MAGEGEDLYKALRQSAYKAEHGAEATDEELEDFFKERGKTVLGIAQISEEDLNEKISSRTLEMTDVELQKQEQKRLERRIKTYNKFHSKKVLTEEEMSEILTKRDAKWSRLPFIHLPNLPYLLGKGASESITKTINYFFHKDRSRIRQLDKNKEKAKEEGFSKEEQQSLSGRIILSAKDGKASEDEGVTNLSEHDNNNNNNSNSNEYKAIREFTATVATTDKSKKADDTIEEARKKTLEQLSETKDGTAVVDLEKIEHDLRGALVGIDKTKTSKEEVLGAIDKYLEKHVSIISADVKTGLAAKEVYDKLEDRATIEHGVFAGAVVELGASLVGFVRSKLVQSATNGPGLSQHVVKVIFAGAYGAFKAGNAEEKRQKKANIDAAINNGGNSVNATKDKKGREHTFEIVGSSELTKELLTKAKEINDLDKDAASLGDLAKHFEDALSLISEIRVRNMLQNEHGVQLIGYDGRENIEKSKLEMFEAISKLKKAMQAKGLSSTIFDEQSNQEMKARLERYADKFEDRFMSIRRAQKSERRSARWRGGLTAALTAAAIDQLLHHDAISKDFKDFKQTIMNSDQYKQLEETIRKPFAVPVAASSETATADITTPTRPEELNPIASEVGTNHENYEQYYHTPVVIEKDPDGSGWVVALDADGDGAITDADKIISGSLESDGVAGIDLTNEENIKALNVELADYKIELQHEAITVSRYGETSISDYLDRAENSVDNSGGVDWSRNMVDRAVIGDPIVVSADGMDSYEIPIAEINGGFPDGAKLLIDFDGDNGPGRALEYTIENGKAIVPADIVDTSMVGNGGVAQIIGVARVGEVVDGNKMISYVTKFGKSASLSDMISVSDETSGFAFTAVDLANNGERLSQFAVDVNNELFSNGNMSEIFNGIETINHDHLPATIKVNDIGDGQSDLVLAKGGTIKDFDVQGGYHAEYDAFENIAFKADGSDTYLGTPIIWDTDGDGAMSAAEEVSYVRQMFVRTATNPYMLGQNASNYGILEPERLEKLGITKDFLSQQWKIGDGVIDTEEDLNIFLEKLKDSPDLWDKVANETINEMETQLQGAEFEVETVSSRLSTFANSNRAIDTARASTPRTAIYAYRVGESGEKTYIGNQGWWCRKYGGDAANLKVGDMPRCEQKCIIQGSTPTTPPTPVTPVAPVEPPVNPPTSTPTSTSTLDSKNIEAEIENAGDNVVPEYVATPAAPLSESPYEVNADNIIEHTVSTEESAANAAKAAADAIAAAEAAAEGDKIIEAVEQASSQEEIDNIGADLWRQFQGGQ